MPTLSPMLHVLTGVNMDVPPSAAGLRASAQRMGGVRTFNSTFALSPAVSSLTLAGWQPSGLNVPFTDFSLSASAGAAPAGVCSAVGTGFVGVVRRTNATGVGAQSRWLSVPLPPLAVAEGSTAALTVTVIEAPCSGLVLQLTCPPQWPQCARVSVSPAVFLVTAAGTVVANVSVSRDGVVPVWGAPVVESFSLLLTSFGEAADSFADDGVSLAVQLQDDDIQVLVPPLAPVPAGRSVALLMQWNVSSAEVLGVVSFNVTGVFEGL